MGKTNKEKVIERARKKIIANINYIYENLNVEKEIIKQRKKFLIPDNFFVDYKVRNDPTFYLISDREIREAISLLLMATMNVWKNRILIEKNKLDKAVNNFGKKRYTLWLNKFQNPTATHKWAFVMQYLVKFFVDDITEINKPIRVNSRVWGILITAKLFEIPQKLLMTYMESMLKHYFPTVDKKMRIQFNELTSIEDVKHIWSEVEKQQKKYTKKFGIIEKEDYINHDRDKRAYELKKNDPKISRKKIKKILKEEKYKTNFKTPHISKIIKKYKNYINQ
ncbi:hypothetical protein KAR28_06505 [Candidatus Parcubacteria bacterium]|nr:hypothetical protein [Candidatus Parcubacteria bacterium]